MARPKKKKIDPEQNTEVKDETTKPKKGRKPAIITEIERIMAEYEAEYGHPPTILSLNHEHYKAFLKAGQPGNFTIHSGTSRIDKIRGMSYFLDHDEEEMSVR